MRNSGQRALCCVVATAAAIALSCPVWADDTVDRRCEAASESSCRSNRQTRRPRNCRRKQHPAHALRCRSRAQSRLSDLFTYKSEPGHRRASGCQRAPSGARGKQVRRDWSKAFAPDWLRPVNPASSSPSRTRPSSKVQKSRKRQGWRIPPVARHPARERRASDNSDQKGFAVPSVRPRRRRYAAATAASCRKSQGTRREGFQTHHRARPGPRR